MQDIKRKLEDIAEEISSLENILQIKEKKEIVLQLQLKMSEANFWEDSKKASSIVAKLKDLKNDINSWEDINEKLKYLQELLSFYDASLEEDIQKELAVLGKDCDNLKLRVLFSGKFDNSNAIVEINSGAGGTEACDWSEMLFRMYFRWAEDKRFKFQIFNELKGEEAGLKSITFYIQGNRAYGLLKSERGVHRLVRISPFDANKRRHTSFASVDVLPEIKEEIDIVIKPEDLKIDTFRSSGAGGQHVNVTNSAVRITHLSSGIVVGCQNERSQYQNKETALKVLKAKLYEIKEQENAKELEKMSGQKQRIEWGSQIRSYVLHPYLLVKDHRTGFEEHNAWAVLDGKIDDFIHTYLEYNSSKK